MSILLSRFVTLLLFCQHVVLILVKESQLGTLFTVTYLLAGPTVGEGEGLNKAKEEFCSA